jgi:hypothetical protein
MEGNINEPETKGKNENTCTGAEMSLRGLTYLEVTW